MATPPPQTSEALSFSLRVQEDRAAAVAGGWLTGPALVEYLEIEIPEVAFPLDLEGGATRFQRRRGRFAEATLSIAGAALDELVATARDELAQSGIHDLRLRILDGAIEVSARLVEGERSADLTARALVTPAGRAVRLALTEVRLYGWLPRPAILVGHDLLTLLSRLAGDGETSPLALPLGTEPPGEHSPIERFLFPVDAILWRGLPPSGWRLPDAASLRVIAATSARGRLEIRATGSPDSTIVVADAARTEQAWRDVDATRDADRRLAEGDLEGAAGLYRAQIAREGNAPGVAVERLLGLLAARDPSGREAIGLAREAIARDPDFLPGHLCLGVALAEAGRAAEAATHFAEAAELAERTGDDEVMVRAAASAARLFREVDPDRQIALYEKVLERRFAAGLGHAEAAEALHERYTAEERWADVVRLSRRRIAVSGDRREQARELVRAAEIHLVRLGEAETAKADLERATQLVDNDPRAWDLLGRTLTSLGDAQGAVRAVDRLALLYAAKGDTVGEARTHVRIGALWEILGDDAHAHGRYQRALELLPEDADALERFAGVTRRRGKAIEAAQALERLVAVTPSGDPRHRRALRELGALYIAAGDLDRARGRLERGIGGDASDEAQRLALLAELARQDGRPLDGAALLAEAAALTIPPAEAAELELRRAALADAGGAPADADSARERAHALAPMGLGLEAAAALALGARARGDLAAEARWLDAVLAGGDRAPASLPRAEAALRRAELAVAAGDGGAALERLSQGSGLDSLRELPLRAEAQALAGDFAGSAATLETLAAESSGEHAVDWWIRAADRRLLADDDAGALAAARRAFDLDPTHPGARSALGNAAFRAREFAEVVTAYSSGPTEDQEELRRLGTAYERLGREHEAVVAYRTAVAIHTAKGEPLRAAWRRLAEIYERSGELSRAADALASAAADTRTDENAAARAEQHHRAAELYRKRLGQPDRAEAELEAALRLAPEHLPSLDALEAIHNEAEDYERVAAILGRKVAATARHPERQKALLSRLAELQAQRLGRPDVAREAYARTLEIDPSFLPALEYLAEDAKSRGALGEAESHLLRIVQLPASPDDEIGEGARLRAQLALAAIAREGNRASDVERHLLLALETSPSEALWDELEQLYREASRWPELVALYSRRRERTPDPTAKLALDRKAIEVLVDRLDDPRAALSACRAALGRWPDDLALWRLAERAARAAEETKDLATALERIGALDQGAVVRRAARREAADLWRHDLGDLRHARRLLEELWQDAPDDAGVGQALVEVTRALGDEEAATHLETLVNAAISPEAALRQARALVAIDDVAGARAELDKLDTAVPEGLELERADLAAEVERRELERAAAPPRPDPQSPEGMAESLQSIVDELATEGSSLSRDARSLLGHLRVAAHGAGSFGPLAQGLEAAAGIEVDKALAAALFSEAAALRRTALDDPGGAADALERALALSPGDTSIMKELEEALRTLGVYTRLKQALELHLSVLPGPARAPILHSLGKLSADAFGDPVAAAACFVEAHEADPSFWDVLVPLADWHYGEGRTDDAEALYRQALATRAVSREDHGQVAARVGELALKRGDVPEAIARFREALAAFQRTAGGPQDLVVDLVLSWLEHALRAAGEWHEVAQLLMTRARREDERDARLTMLREAAAIWEETLSRPDEALVAWHEIAKLDPESPEVAERLGEQPRIARVELVKRRASELAEEQTAEEEFTPEPPAEGLPPSAAEAWWSGGVPTEPPLGPDEWLARNAERARLTEEGDAAGLVAALDRDAGVGPASERAMLLAESARVSAETLHDFDGALGRYGAAIGAAVTDETRHELHGERAELLSRIGRVDEARAELDGALHDRPPTGLGHLALGRIHLMRDDAEGALPHLLVAAGRLAAPPHLAAEAHLLAGQAHELLGQPEQAMARYETASQVSPLDPRPLEALETLTEKRGDWEFVAELLGRQILHCTTNASRAALWLRRAKLYRDILGREPEAYRCLKEAFANDPTLTEASQALRQVAMARGEWALCAELLYREIEVATAETDRAALHVELALIYEERLLDIDAAIRNYESAIALDTDAPLPAAALARLYALVQRFPDAARAEELAAAAEDRPEVRAERLLRAGEHMERAGRPDEARKRYDAAAEVPGGADAAAAAQAKAERLGTPTADPERQRATLTARLDAAGDEEKIAILKQLLTLAVELGDDREVEQRAREVLAHDGADVMAFLQRRRLLTARSEWLALAELYRSRADLVDDNGERASLYFDLGRICAHRLGDPARAALAFDQALRYEPGHAPALDSLADMAYRQHDWSRANQLYARLDPDASFLGKDVVHYRRGELAEMLGYEERAESSYQSAVLANPSHLQALEALARLALYRGEVPSAISALRGVLDLLPLDDVDRITATRQQLGELCQRAGDNPMARQFFELVLVEDPTRIAALAPLAELYAASGHWQKAAETLGRLSYLVISPEKRADLLFRVGEIYRLHLGDDDRASDAYLKAIDLDPRHVPTMRRLVDYYWSVGDDASIAEMAHDLEARGELLNPDTTGETVARVAVAAALGGDVRWGATLMGAQGPAAAGSLAIVLADAAARRPRAREKLVSVARALCASPGPPLDAVREVLKMRASKDPHAELLAVAI